MTWNVLHHLDQLVEIINESNEKNVLIFKHSTSCSISHTTLNRLERNWKESEVPNMKPYFLDLLTYRKISNAIAEQFGVEHQSPQVLIISMGQSIYNSSHIEIDFQSIKSLSKN